MIIKCNKCHKTHDVIVKGEEFVPSNNAYLTNNKTDIAYYDTQIANKIIDNNKEHICYKCIDCGTINII